MTDGDADSDADPDEEGDRLTLSDELAEDDGDTLADGLGVIDGDADSDKEDEGLALPLDDGDRLAEGDTLADGTSPVLVSSHPRITTFPTSVAVDATPLALMSVCSLNLIGDRRGITACELAQIASISGYIVFIV